MNLLSSKLTQFNLFSRPGLFKVLKNIFYDFILYEKLGLIIIVELKVEKRMTNSVSFSL